jgi:hypothetical protein
MASCGGSEAILSQWRLAIIVFEAKIPIKAPPSIAPQNVSATSAKGAHLCSANRVRSCEENKNE